MSAVDLTGKVSMITGATGGMGLVIATELARMGSTVVIVARDMARGEHVRQRIAQDVGVDRIEVLEANLASRADLHHIAETFTARHDRLHILVNNAGAHYRQRLLTPDGIEMHLAVDHLAGFALTVLLLDQLRAGTPARVVNVVSESMSDTRQIKVLRSPRPVTLAAEDLRDLHQINPEQGFTPFTAYARAKLLTTMCGYELADRLADSGITVNAVHPALVATGIVDDFLPRQPQLPAPPAVLTTLPRAGFIHSPAHPAQRTAGRDQFTRREWHRTAKTETHRTATLRTRKRVVVVRLGGSAMRFRRIRLRRSWRASVLSVPLVLLTSVVVAVVTPATAHAASDVVTDGNARFEVLTPTLIRLEYAGDDAFQDGATFNAVNRSFPVPPYTTDVTSDGYREIHTSGADAALQAGQRSVHRRQPHGHHGRHRRHHARPPSPRTASRAPPARRRTRCSAGPPPPRTTTPATPAPASSPGTRAPAAAVHPGRLAVPSTGTYRLLVRYANSTGGDGRHHPHPVHPGERRGRAGPQLPGHRLLGHLVHRLGHGPTSTPAPTPSTLRAERRRHRRGQHRQHRGDARVGTTAYPAAPTTLTTTGYGAGPTDTLGGWSRSLDNPATLPVPEHPGILDRDGWYLLDDSRTALLSAGAHRHRPPLARRTAVPGRLLLRLRPGLQAGR